MESIVSSILKKCSTKRYAELVQLLISELEVIQFGEQDNNPKYCGIITCLEVLAHHPHHESGRSKIYEHWAKITSLLSSIVRSTSSTDLILRCFSLVSFVTKDKVGWVSNELVFRLVC